MSVTFIQRLKDLLSYEDKLKYAAALTAAGLHPKKAHGRYAINELAKFVEESADNISSVVDLSQPVKKHRDDKPRKAAHAVLGEPQDADSSEEVYQINASAQAQPKPKKPCALRGHLHELGSCEDFLSIPPYKRRILTEARMCWTCLGPRGDCKVSNQNDQLSCKNFASLNKVLICTLCEEFIKSNNKSYSPCNVLMCTIKSHVSAFPPSEVLLPALAKLLPNFDKSKLRLPQVKFVNNVTTLNASRQSSSQRAGIPAHRNNSNLNRGPVAVDSHSGKIKRIDKESIIPEVKENSVFIMQMLKIGSRETLVLFDTGASMHLMEGELAETFRKANR